MESNRLKLICHGTFNVGSGWLNTASRGYNRLYYINGGKGVYVKSGKRIPFEKGKVYYIPFYSGVITYADHDIKLDHDYTGFYLTPPTISTEVFCLDPDSSAITRRAADLFRELCKKRKLSDEEAKLLSDVSLYLVDTAVNASPDDVVKDGALIKALDLIHSSIPDRLTVFGIAKECNLSTNGFIKKFTRSVGETPYSYIKKVKLSAALMLRDGGASLDEAAAASGYSDASALLHALKKEEIYRSENCLKLHRIGENDE